MSAANERPEPGWVPDPDTRAYLDGQVRAVLAALTAGDVEGAMRIIGHLDREFDDRAGAVLLGDILRQLGGNLVVAASQGDRRALVHLRAALDMLTSAQPDTPETHAAAASLPGPRRQPPDDAAETGPGRPETTPAAALAETAGAVTGELARVDGKTGTLLGVLTAGAAVLTTVGSGRHLIPGAAACLWAADGLLGVALVLLLLSVRPTLTGTTGWLAYADMTPPQAVLSAGRAGDDITQAGHTINLARIARAKFRRLRTAVDLILAAGGLLILGLVASIR